MLRSSMVLFAAITLVLAALPGAAAVIDFNGTAGDMYSEPFSHGFTRDFGAFRATSVRDSSRWFETAHWMDEDNVACCIMNRWDDDMLAFSGSGRVDFTRIDEGAFDAVSALGGSYRPTSPPQTPPAAIRFVGTFVGGETITREWSFGGDYVGGQQMVLDLMGFEGLERLTIEGILTFPVVIDDLELVPVPEPGTAALVAWGLFALAARCRAARDAGSPVWPCAPRR